ncbi:MAG TPA: MarR family transcriptional regulator [Pseudonocardia sp.]|jgi:DNA-binding MarR family transcriptional regulator|nr:MarR family transcriptional regulator [Pseudonocardia sp.]
MTQQRRDLGEMLMRLGNAFVAAEGPVLAARDLVMWDYVVLLALREGPARSQARLAELAGRDQTRLIPILDRLASAGLVRREPDPADRRSRVVELTGEGRVLVEACRADIRARESELLAAVPEHDRAAFVERLQQVADSLTPWP